MMSTDESLPFRRSTLIGAAVAATLVSTFLVSDPTPVHANEEKTSPVVGSFAVGGSVTAGVDERLGAFTAQVPLAALPGIDGRGAVNIGVSYSQDLAADGRDPHGLGAGWGWGVPRVEIDAGVRVVTPSGGVYSAAAEEAAPSDERDSRAATDPGVSSPGSTTVPSGLEGYVQGDLVFDQTGGVLDPASPDVDGIPYAYSLEHLGGVTDYFGTAGDLIVRVDVFGFRTVWEWADDHRLRSVVDGAGSQVGIDWSHAGVELVSRSRSDGVAAKTTLNTDGGRLESIMNPADERVAFIYGESGLLERVKADSGAVTEITYQPLPHDHLPAQKRMAVDTVRVIDSETSTELSIRHWRVSGNHNPQGSPTYAHAAQLWGSGDGEYRYRTLLTDDETEVASEYNSMGLMLSRQTTVSTPDGERRVHETEFTFPGTENGGVPDRQHLPPQYAQPVTARAKYYDAYGATREVIAQTVFDESGRLTKHDAADGSVTETFYDTEIPAGRTLPIGLVVRQTTTGNDGLLTSTVNELSPDRRTVRATETRVRGPQDDDVPEGDGEHVSRTEFDVRADGFVSEQRVIATGKVTEEPERIITRFDRHIDRTAGTVTMSRIDAAETAAQSSTSTVTDLATGLVLSATDPTGRIGSSRYDAAGRVIVEIAPGGLHTITEYGKKVTRVTNPVGVTHSEYVDVLGRVVKTTDNLAPNTDGTIVPKPGIERTIETRRYEQNASQMAVTDPRGLTTITNTDVFGRLVSVTSPSGVKKITVYDDVENTVRSGIVGPSGTGLKDALHITTQRMDDSNRNIATTTTRQDGIHTPETTTTYDGLGRVTTHNNADLSTSVAMNPNGTPKTTTTTPTNPHDFPGQPVTANREHDLHGVSTKKTLTQANGQNREGITRRLDAARRTTHETNQNGNTSQYTYTQDGLVATVHNEGTGVVTRNTYDPITRAHSSTEKTGTDGTPSTTLFDHDTVTGNLLNVCDASDCENTRVSYSYDIFGNITQMTYPDKKTIRHTYDEYGRKTGSTDIDGNVTVFEHHQSGLLSAVTQTSPAGALLGQVKYTYDEYGRTRTLTRDNGTTTEYTFTSANEISTETTKHGHTIIYDATYTYDSHGNLIRRIDTRPQGTDTDKPVTETTTHAYNAYDQLIESAVYPGSHPTTPPAGSNTTATARETTVRHATHAPSAVEAITKTLYEISVSGEITKETVITNPTPGANLPTDATTTTREFEYNALGHTTAITTKNGEETSGHRVTQTYDPAGNLTRAVNGTTYSYNIHNQAVTETRADGVTSRNSYWATGQRAATITESGLDNADTLAGGENPSTRDNAAVGRMNQHNVRLYWDGSTIINDVHTAKTVDASNVNKPLTLEGFDDGTQATGSYLVGATRHTRNLAVTTTSGDVETTNSHYVTDRHGNTTALTDGDGDVTAAYTYSDYGATTVHTAPQHTDGAATRNPFQYASEYTTPNRVQLLGQRSYDPTVFAFTTKDTADQFNLYAYAGSNPITLIDPTGQTPVRDIINWVTLGIGIVFTLLSAGIVGAAAAAAGATAWANLSIGLGVASTVTDIASTSIAGVLIARQQKDNLNEDTNSEILTWVGFGLSLFGAALGVGAGIAATKAHNVITTPSGAQESIFTGTWTRRDIRGTLGDSLGKRAMKQHPPNQALLKQIYNNGTGDTDAYTNFKAAALGRNDRLTNTPGTTPRVIKENSARTFIVDAHNPDVLLLKEATELRARMTGQLAEVTTEAHTVMETGIGNRSLEDLMQTQQELYGADSYLIAVQQSAYRALTGDSATTKWTILQTSAGEIVGNNQWIIRGNWIGF